MIYTVFQYSLALVALLTFGLSFVVKAKRGVLIWAAVSAAAGALAARYQVFWAFAVFTMMIPWALFCAGDWIDLNWRLKTGFVVFLTIASALCIYPTYVDERFASPDRDKSLTTEQQDAVDAKARAGEMGFGRFLRSNIPFRLVRGLDLKGGLRLVYNVDVQTAIREKRDRTHEQMYSSLAVAYGFTKDGEVAKESEKDKLDGLVKVEKAKDDVGKLVVTFTDPADKAKINDEFLKRYTDTFDVDKTQPNAVTFRIKQVVEEETRTKAVDQAKETVRRRIDGLGLKEAAVTPSGEDIIVEMPGDDERQFKQVEDLIGETARLEFKMCDDRADFFGKVKADPARQKTMPKQIAFYPQDVPIGEGKGSQTNQIPTWIKGDDETMESALTSFKAWVATLDVPDQRSVAYGKHYAYDGSKDNRTEDGWEAYYLYAAPAVTGEMITEAGARMQSDGGLSKWIVAMDFNSEGAERFEKVTGDHVKERFAIVLDGKVESAPVINGKIGGGSGIITMGAPDLQGQLEAAKKLELVLKSGALPAPIVPSNKQIIGPSLGTDAIFQGVKGGVAGGALVLALMMLIYSRAGIIANIAVLFNLVLQVAVLAMLNASLTLPGIAGLTLTIGIAVDANVLINERIRDELRLGKSARSAVEIGYDRAFTAILDGHVTSFLSGLILMQYGTGPIKGFAVTLIVGVLVSLFTGVVCTRLMFDWAVRWRKVKKLSLG